MQPQPLYLSGYKGNFNPSLQFTITNGQKLSSIIVCGGLSLVGIFIPAGFTGTALTFEASVDGISFFPVNSTESGTSLSYVVAESTYCSINPDTFYGINYLIVKSGSNEGADRTLYASLKGF